jgi:predicted site-specific integrase-resolvase
MSLREQERRQRQHNPLVVYPFLDWCKMRGISVATGRRVIAAGRVKVTQLSERRMGIRSDHDQEYLDSCLRDSA